MLEFETKEHIRDASKGYVKRYKLPRELSDTLTVGSFIYFLIIGAWGTSSVLIDSLFGGHYQSSILHLMLGFSLGYVLLALVFTAVFIFQSAKNIKKVYAKISELYGYLTPEAKNNLKDFIYAPNNRELMQSLAESLTCGKSIISSQELSYLLQKAEEANNNQIALLLAEDLKQRRLIAGSYGDKKVSSGVRAGYSPEGSRKRYEEYKKQWSLDIEN